MRARRPASTKKDECRITANAPHRSRHGYRLCYVRGPEGSIIELAEQIG